MKSNLVPPRPFVRTLRSGIPSVFATLAVAAMFTTQTVAQSGPADSANPANPTNLESAPAPVQQANLAAPVPNLHVAYARPGDQVMANTLVTTERPTHHVLAKTAIVAGIGVLGFGAAAYAVEASHCHRTTNVCSSLKSGGIGAMAGGGALAATGFYFNFRKPKQ